MTSRRLIRIKTLQLLYAHVKKEGATIAETEKDLLRAIDKTTELYYLVFLLIVEIQHRAFLKIDAARNRHLPSYEDLHPNTRFVDNPVIRALADNRVFKARVNTLRLSLDDVPELVGSLYETLAGLPFFQRYMGLPAPTRDDHRQLVLDMITELFADNENLDQTLEERNIYWNDDLELVLSMAYKTVRRFRASDDTEANLFLAIFDEDEDVALAKTLLRRSILDLEPNMQLIDRYTNNWDLDRISDIDKLIMDIAISELKYAPSIPVKVTLDEYIEISKAYGSTKSSTFINGILDKILLHLQGENQIHKIGRGLMEYTPTVAPEGDDATPPVHRTVFSTDAE